MATIAATPQPQILPPPVRGLIVPETPDGFTFRVGRSPATMIAEAEVCATALMAAVKRNGWVKNFNGRDHLYFEAWAFLAMMYRVTARVKETRLVRIDDITGYEAFAEAFYIPSQLVISTADSMCLDDEDNWDTRPEYEWSDGPNGKRIKKQVGERQVPLFQLRSMSQTRAMSRALRGPFSWIIAMAGYAPTPAEDMGSAPTATEGATSQPQQQQQQQMPKEKPHANGGALINDKQVKRIWGIAYSLVPNRTAANDAVRSALTQFGFDDPSQVTLDKYDDLINVIQQTKGGAAAQ